MKAVLISIKPKYCELIANGKKSLEIRKSKPKLKPPFKVYVYQTVDKRLLTCFKKGEGTGWYHGDDPDDEKVFEKFTPVRRVNFNSKKIIGEFICDNITTIFYGCEILYGIDYPNRHSKQLEDNSCLTLEELKQYANGKELYAWHISDLKIYDKPKELSEFRKPGGRQCVLNNGRCCKYIQAEPDDDPGDQNTMSCIYGETNCPFEHLNRPPQSWCYVERYK